MPSTGKLPTPLQTSPPPQPNQYAAYSQGPPGGQGPGPQGTYGNPQELSTSVYDSPIATNNPGSAATYSSSVYSADEYAPSSPVAAGRAPSYPAPSAPTPSAPSQSQPPPQPTTYQAYTTYHQQQQQQQQQPPSQPPPQNLYGGHGYDGVSPDVAPPQPAGQAPPIPHSRPPHVLTPPPLHPSGPAYDARQSLPSRLTGPGGPSAPSAPGQAEHQYKAYVPPPADAPSAPSDYYRQPGGVSYS